MLATTFVAVSCVNNDIPKGQESDAQGTLVLSKISLSEAVEVINKTRAGASIDDFKVCITRAADGMDYLDCQYCDMPESLPLPVGEYKIAVTSHEVRDAEWNKPYYAVTEFFEITRNQTREITELVCNLANIMVSVAFTDNSLDLMGDDAVVAIRIGTAWLYYGVAEARTDIPFNRDNYRRYQTDPGFFKAKDVTAESPAYDMLYWEFSGEVEGEFLEDAGTVPNVKAGEHRKLTFDINRTPIPGEETGSVEFIFTVQVEVESYDLNLNVEVTEEYIGELDQAVEFGSTHSFAARNTLRASECLTGGVVKTPVNMTLDAAEGLRNVFVEFTTDSDGLSAEFAARGLAGTFDLASPGAAADALNAIGLPTGTAVAGRELLTLDLRGLIGLAFDCGGANELDIRVTAYDRDGNVAAKTLRFKIVDDSVPSDIAIVWVGNDITCQQTITGSTDLAMITSGGEEVLTSKVPIVISVGAPHGIASLIVEIISDNPLFGVDVLRAIGLDTRFDLVAPHDVGAENPMDEVLAAFGFPVGDDVKDKTELQFDITTFVPLIYMVSDATHNEVEFKLTVVDNKGNDASESIMLKIDKDIEY